MPSKLAHKSYTAGKPSEENAKNNIVNRIAEEHNGQLQFLDKQPRKRNISKDEKEGLQWLINESKESNIAVVKADKGGVILIVEQTLLEKAVTDKLEDPNLYQLLDSDPYETLHDEIFYLWVQGKLQRFVSPVDPKRVMGVTAENNKSTASRFKPGTSYFYPMLKIHKLTTEQLIGPRSQSACPIGYSSPGRHQ
jgi:hypothetical protein